MGDRSEDSAESLASRYIRAYQDKISLYKEQSELVKRLEVLERQEVIFKDIVSRCHGKNAEVDDLKQQYPIILGTAHTRMSVTSLGKLPDGDEERFHSRTAIYPVGYTMRRKYTMYRDYKKKTKSKITYTCMVDSENVFVIKADDGHKWEGEDCWEKFSKDFDGRMKFKDIEEFFGFTHVTLLQLIESLGDTARFKNYVPVEERKGVSKDLQMP